MPLQHLMEDDPINETAKTDAKEDPRKSNAR